MALSSPFLCAKLVVVGVNGAQNVKWDSDTSRTFSVVQPANGRVSVPLEAILSLLVSPAL